MKRATLLLEDEVYQQAKELSSKKGTSLKEAINDLLIRGLNTISTRRKSARISLPLHKCRRPNLGVDITDRDALNDLLDKEQ